MAGKLIIDWSKAPVDATHAYIDCANNTVWLKFNIGGGISRSTLGSAWVPCEYTDFSDEKLEVNPAITAVMQSPPGNRLPMSTEQSMCCGTTCDREAVKRYIERLEVVADAAHHLEASGVLAGTPRMQNLKTALGELKSE